MSVEKQAAKDAIVCWSRRRTALIGARDQHKIADKQHTLANKQRDNAERLVVIGQTLEADAAKLGSEIEFEKDPHDTGSHGESSRAANVDGG